MASREHVASNAPMAAIGSYESVLPFQAIGLEVVVITEETEEKIASEMSRFAQEGYVILFLEEALFSKYQEAVDEINDASEMAIIPVPNQTGSQGVGFATIRKNVERAVGMDIFGVK